MTNDRAQIDPEPLDRLVNHAGPRLAALAVHPKRLDERRRMVWAIKPAVDAGAALLECGSHPCVEIRDERLRVETKADASLIGRDAHDKPGPIEQADRVGRPRKPPQVVETAEVADLFDHRAVAVEKHSRTHAVSSDATRRAVTALYTVSIEMRFMQR